MAPSHWVARLLSQYADCSAVALFFDFDGTLAPIVAHPGLAALPSGTRAVLAEIAGIKGVNVGIISGRTLAQLRHLVGLPEVWYAGSGGMHLDLCGKEVSDPALVDFEAIASSLCEEILEVVEKFPGAWLERKPGCLTTHYRALEQAIAEEFLLRVKSRLSDRARLRLAEVDRGLEVSLADSWTKAEAVERMLQCWGTDPFVMYAGNAANDESAMLRVNALGGITVGVGPEAPDAAQCWVANSEEFSSDLVLLHGGILRATRKDSLECGIRKTFRCGMRSAES